jgi:hypothetical protein
VISGIAASPNAPAGYQHLNGTKYEYDALNRRRTETVGTVLSDNTISAMRTTSYAYDATGNLLSMTAPAPNNTSVFTNKTVVTSYDYDLRDRRTKQYDDWRLLPQQGAPPKEAYGRLTEWNYYLDGQVLSVETGRSKDYKSHAVQTVYTYDKVNRVKEIQEAVGSPFARQTVNDYDKTGNLTAVTTGISLSPRPRATTTRPPPRSLTTSSTAVTA